VFGKNIDRSKVKLKVGMQHFFSQAFKYFYIAIWSCVKLEDVLKVLPMFMCKTFLEQFSFGDMKNVPKHLAKFPMGLIII
jgi:hypothetical protein